MRSCSDLGFGEYPFGEEPLGEGPFGEEPFGEELFLEESFGGDPFGRKLSDAAPAVIQVGDLEASAPSSLILSNRLSGCDRRKPGRTGV